MSVIVRKTLQNSEIIKAEYNKLYTSIRTIFLFLRQITKLSPQKILITRILSIKILITSIPLINITTNY